MVTKTFTSQDPALTINYIGFVYRKLIEQGYVSKTLLKNTNLTEDDLFNPVIQAKLPKPIRKSKKITTTFKVRIDI